MKAPKLQKQTTIKIGKETIKIIVRRKTSQANFIGWNVFINGIKYFKNCLTMNEAVDKAYTSYIQKCK